MSNKVLLYYGNLCILLCISFAFLCANTVAYGESKIYGYVNDSDGNAIKKVRVTCKGKNTGQKGKDKTDSKGFFEMEGLEADTYKITVKKRKYKKVKKTVTLEDGESMEMEFSLSKKGGSDHDSHDCIGIWDGSYSGYDSGTWNVEVDDEGNITGSGNSDVYYITFDLLGSAGVGTFEIDSSGFVLNGKEYVITFSGILDTLRNEVSGTWEISESGVSGTFQGNKQ